VNEKPTTAVCGFYKEKAGCEWKAQSNIDIQGDKRLSTAVYRLLWALLLKQIFKQMGLSKLLCIKM